MKKIFLAMAMVAAVNVAKADYSQLQLHYMALTADTVVCATITSVNKTTITVSVQNRRMTIEKFENWTCAERYAPYKVGQKALFFLQLKGGKYYVMSAGNEGELPINNDSLYLCYGYYMDVDLKDEFSNPKKHFFNEGMVYGVPIPYDYLLSAISCIRSSFSFELNEYRRITNLKKNENVSNACSNLVYKSLEKELLNLKQ